MASSHSRKLTSKLQDYTINQIDGDTYSGTTTTGAFLDFLSTNQWKNEQANKFFDFVKQGKVGKDDQILFTDAWNPVITEIKYVNDLMGMNWKLHGLWHAGSYDCWDILGRAKKSHDWMRHTEKAIFNALDHNYFATDFHANLFVNGLLLNGIAPINPGFKINTYKRQKKIIQTGWPMEYMWDVLKPYMDIPKEDIILFPHRLAPEKQLDIFKDLEKQLPAYQFIVCQEKTLTKHEYHTLIARSKMVFSASLQETYGIAVCVEAPILNTIPLAPDRLSYNEMLLDVFKYPSTWTKDFSSYEKHKDELCRAIIYRMANYNAFKTELVKYQMPELQEFYTCENLIKQLQSI